MKISKNISIISMFVLAFFLFTGTVFALTKADISSKTTLSKNHIGETCSYSFTRDDGEEISGTGAYVNTERGVACSMIGLLSRNNTITNLGINEDTFIIIEKDDAVFGAMNERSCGIQSGEWNEEGEYCYIGAATVPIVASGTREQPVLMRMSGSGNPGNTGSGSGGNSGPIIPICIPGFGRPWVRLSMPNGGEVFEAGEAITVKWRSCNIPSSDYINIGIGWPASWNVPFGVTMMSALNTGSATMILPDSSNFYSGALQYGNFYETVISLANNTGVTDRSDDPYAIVAPPVDPNDFSPVPAPSSVGPARVCLPGITPSWIRVIEPNGTEVFAPREDITVKWKSCNISGAVDISLAQQNQGGPGYANWTLSANNADSWQETFTLPSTGQWNDMVFGKNFKIHITESQGSSPIEDSSDELFSIVNCPNLPFEGGTGTASDPYQICTCEQLRNIDDDPSAHFELIIDNVECAQSEDWNNGAGFSPLPYSNLAPLSFTGVLDGNNNVISNLHSSGGLFKQVSNAEIRNLGLEDIVAKKGSLVSGAVGQTIISNVYATGDVSASSMSSGGLVELLLGGTIANSYFSGRIHGGNHNTGGLVGYMEGQQASVSNSYAEGSVEGGSEIGGLVGFARMGSSISNSHATNAVTGSGQFVGGLVGNIMDTTISDSYATGSVAGGSFTGGFVGSSRQDGFISNSYATGSVEGNGHSIGGFAGDIDRQSSISNSYATGSVEGLQGVGGFVGDIDDSIVSNSYAEGDSHGGGYGARVGGFVGVADGSSITNSHSKGDVSGANSETLGGFAGYLYDMNVSDSHATGDVDSSGTGSQAGGFAGKMNNSTVLSSHATGAVMGNDRVGGFSGDVYNSEISLSYATGAVIGDDRIGGLFGYIYNAIVSNSYSTSSVQGSSYVGGLAGYLRDSAVSNTYAAGTVVGNNNVGGLVGKLWGQPSQCASSYWNTQVTGLFTSACGTSQYTSQMQQQSTYSGWDFTNIWSIDPGTNNGYPFLR